MLQLLHTHAHTCTHTHVCTHTCTHVHARAHTPAHTCNCIYTHTCRACTHTSAHIHTHVHTHMCTPVYIDTCTHIYTHTHRHICTHPCAHTPTHIPHTCIHTHPLHFHTLQFMTLTHTPSPRTGSCPSLQTQPRSLLPTQSPAFLLPGMTRSFPPVSPPPSLEWPWAGREPPPPPQQTCPGPQLLCHLPCHPERDVTKSQGPYVSGKLTTATGIHLLLGRAWGWGCPLRGDGSTLKLDCGEGCTTLQVSKKKKKRESKLCRVISTERIVLW